MKIVFIDPYAGAAGDMFLGALIDAGWPISNLERELEKVEAILSRSEGRILIFRFFVLNSKMLF